MFAVAPLALAALASVAVAAPIDSTVLASVDASLSLPNTTQTNQVAYYWQNGNAGACGLYSEDSDLVVGLPLEFYNDTGSVSPYCGSYVVVENLANNASVTARVADASATNNLLSLSVGTWRALNGDGSDFETAAWRFANKTETAAAKASLASTSFTAQSTIASSSAAAATTTTQAASSTAVVAAEKVTTTTKAYVAPTTTTTTTQKPYTTSKTTTTTKAYTTSKTTTTSKAAQTTAANKSSSSSGSGTYSGQATWFTQNGVAGACGSVHSDSDYIVALDSAMYGSGSYCGKSLTIYANGKSVGATVADECPTCASSGSLDLSLAAFEAISSLDAGVASITWSWN